VPNGFLFDKTIFVGSLDFLKGQEDQLSLRCQDGCICIRPGGPPPHLTEKLAWVPVADPAPAPAGEAQAAGRSSA
jgi:hypothetical protein